MHLKFWILFATLLAVAYATSEPSSTADDKTVDGAKVEVLEEDNLHGRQKRFILLKKLLIKKPLLLGGAVLAKTALLGRGLGHLGR